MQDMQLAGESSRDSVSRSAAGAVSSCRRPLGCSLGPGLGVVCALAAAGELEDDRVMDETVDGGRGFSWGSLEGETTP